MASKYMSLIISLSLMILMSEIRKCDGAFHKDVQRNGASNVRFKELKQSYKLAEKTYYKDYLIFPVERKCEISNFIIPTEAGSELIPLWSDLLNKFLFINEELVQTKDVEKLEEATKGSFGYKKIPWLGLILVVVFLLYGLFFVFAIPIIGCIIFHICDFLWRYAISVGIKKGGRLLIIGYYNWQINHLRTTAPEQLLTRHFRLPMYFREGSDEEDVNAIVAEEGVTGSGDAGGATKTAKTRTFRSQQYKDTSSSSEYDLEEDYRDILIVPSVVEIQTTQTEEQLMEEKQKLIRKGRGRRKSMHDYEWNEPKDPEMEKTLWELQLEEQALYKTLKEKPLTFSERRDAKKTLLQELREERLKRMEEMEKDELERAASRKSNMF